MQERETLARVGDFFTVLPDEKQPRFTCRKETGSCALS